MFSGKKLKISDETYEKVKVACQILRCEIDEFVERTLLTQAEQTIAKTGSKEVSAQEVEDIANKLKGLGYLE